MKVVAEGDEVGLGGAGGVEDGDVGAVDLGSLSSIGPC